VGEQFDGLRISGPITGVVRPAADPQVQQAPVPVAVQTAGVAEEAEAGSIEAVTEEDITSAGVVSPAADPQVEQSPVPVVEQSGGVDEEEEAGSVEGVTEVDMTVVSGYKVDCTELKLIQIFC
jgi:hypothetical protein